ncbi:hypothetical protein Hdeb2414_s0533g00912481 [Helianthus debilis subsp. tardiflorus]
MLRPLLSVLLMSLSTLPRVLQTAMLLRRRMRSRGLPRLIVKEDLMSRCLVLVVLFWCFYEK